MSVNSALEYRTTPAGQKWTSSTIRSRTHSFFGTAVLRPGGSHEENLPLSRTEGASGRYITFPGNSRGNASIMAFHARSPSARRLSAAFTRATTEAAVLKFSTGPVGGNSVKMTPATPSPGVSISATALRSVTRYSAGRTMAELSSHIQVATISCGCDWLMNCSSVWGQLWSIERPNPGTASLVTDTSPVAPSDAAMPGPAS